MAAKLKPLRYVAICPDCDARKDLYCVPPANGWWPQCDECCQSMNIYHRGGTLSVSSSTRMEKE